MFAVYKVSSVHISSGNITVFIIPSDVFLLDNYPGSIVDLNESNFLLLEKEYEPLFHVIPVLFQNFFISFIDITTTNDYKSSVACGFVKKSLFTKGGAYGD